MADLNIDGLLDNFTGKTKVQPEPVPFLQFDKQEEGDEDVEEGKAAYSMRSPHDGHICPLNWCKLAKPRCILKSMQHSNTHCSVQCIVKWLSENPLFI